MEEKKKKIVNTNLGILLICLFCSVFTLADFLVVDHILGKYFDYSKCNCAKCDDSNLNLDGVIDNKKDDDNKGDIWSRYDNISCSTKTSDYCLINNTKNKIELKTSFNKDRNFDFINIIVINDKEYKLDLDKEESIKNVVETSDGNVYIEYSQSLVNKSILLDVNANLISDFEDYYENSFDNAVSYDDGLYKIHSYYKRIGYAIMLCDTYKDDDIFEINKQYKYIGDNKFELVDKIEYTFKDIIVQEKEISGYGSCEAYLSR